MSDLTPDTAFIDHYRFEGPNEKEAARFLQARLQELVEADVEIGQGKVNAEPGTAEVSFRATLAEAIQQLQYSPDDLAMVLEISFNYGGDAATLTANVMIDLLRGQGKRFQEAFQVGIEELPLFTLKAVERRSKLAERVLEKQDLLQPLQSSNEQVRKQASRILGRLQEESAEQQGERPIRGR